MQMIVHLPLLKVSFPGNVSRYFETLMMVVRYDFLNSKWTSEHLYTFDFVKQREFVFLETLDQADDIGYITHNSVINLGSFWMYAVIYSIELIAYFFFLHLKDVYPEK